MSRSNKGASRAVNPSTPGPRPDSANPPPPPPALVPLATAPTGRGRRAWAYFVWKEVVTVVVLPLAAVAATLAYQWWNAQPVLRGDMLFLTETKGTMPGTNLRGVVIGLVLSNGREVPITPIQFLGQYRDKRGVWRTMNLWLDPKARVDSFLVGMPLGGPDETNIVFCGEDILTNNYSLPITRDKPRTAVIAFVRPPDATTDEGRGKDFAFRVVVYDAFGEEYIIRKSDNFINYGSVLSMFPKAISTPTTGLGDMLCKEKAAERAADRQQGKK